MEEHKMLLSLAGKLRELAQRWSGGGEKPERLRHIVEHFGARKSC